jgi:hypothetical protein
LNLLPVENIREDICEQILLLARFFYSQNRESNSFAYSQITNKEIYSDTVLKWIRL